MEVNNDCKKVQIYRKPISILTNLKQAQSKMKKSYVIRKSVP